ADSVVGRACAMLGVRRRDDDRRRRIDRRRVRAVASGGRSAQGNGLGGAGQLSVADVAAAHLSAAAGGDVSSRVDWNGTRTGWVIVAAATCLADSGRGRAGRPAAAWWAALGADDAAFDPLRAAVVAAASRCAANPV